MSEITIAISTLKAAIELVQSKLVNEAQTRNTRHVIDNAPVILNGIRIKQLVKEAKGVLDKGEGPDLKSLATILTEGEFYGDIIKHISHHKLKGNINWDNLEKKLDNLEEKLRFELDKHKHPKCQSCGRESEGVLSGNKKKGNPSDKHPECQSSGRENEGVLSGNKKKGDPSGNVRRSLLYLSRFPTNCVFNRQRISRLLVSHEFVAADKPLLQQLAGWWDPADSSQDGDGASNHFLIRNDVKNLIPTWPESHNLVREVLAESIASMEYEIFCSSLIFLGQRNYTLKLEKNKFLFLKVLSLRNQKLENESYLKELSFLKYLDLKNTENVLDCSWLEGLEELEMLDLRYTRVAEIPGECLQKLGKLQNLLLGYCPNQNENNKRLAGAKLDTFKLKKNLKTLRAIEPTPEINSKLEVADLSLTGLKTGDLEYFWNEVGKFENLTRLGVAVTKNSKITLHECSAKLKKNLKRLRMEGTPIRLEKLDGFGSLVDLTLVLHQPINTDIMISIPKLPKLFCLRLYGFCKKKTLPLSVEGFKSLNKLVIGDMAEVETVEIFTDVGEKVDTLKLCNLRNLSELTYRDSKSRRRLLSRRESEMVPPHRESGTEVQKSIYLRGIENIQFDKSPGLKIYHYDMDKQCYQEVRAILPHDNQI